MRRQIGIGLGALVLGLGGVIAYNALTFAPEGVADASGIKVAAALPIDTQASAKRLGEAIRIQTVSHQDAAENQIGEWAKLHAWLQASYPATHAALQREIVAGNSLVYTWPGSDASLPPIIMMAHQDVVPVTAGTEQDWRYPPFSGTIAEAAVWGRGSVDDKGSLIALFESIELLAKSGFKPKRTVLLVSGHDEEVGGSGAKAVADLLKVRQIKALFTLDEGSAVITDAPMVNGPAIMIAVAEKGYATLKVTATAPGGHSSMPPAEIGTVSLAKAVVAIHADQFPERLQQPVLGTVQALAAAKGGAMSAIAANPWAFGSLIRRELRKTPAGAAQLHTTIAPTMLQGSPKENVLPQSAFALINYRIAPGDSSADVLARAKAAVADLPVTFSWNRPPVEPSAISSSSSQGWKLVRAVAEAENPGAPVAPFLVVAGTDSKNFGEVSQDVYRFQNLRFSTKDTAMIHGTNEHMPLANLEAMIRFYTRLIATSAG
jgi:carboxypeptidase PM20D1